MKKPVLRLKATAFDILQNINDRRDTLFYGAVLGAAVTSVALGSPAVGAVAVSAVVLREGCRGIAWAFEPESQNKKIVRFLSIMLGGLAMVSAVGGGVLLGNALLGTASMMALKNGMEAGSSLGGLLIGSALIPDIRNRVGRFYRDEMFNAPAKARRKEAEKLAVQDVPPSPSEEKRAALREAEEYATLENLIRMIKATNVIALSKTLQAARGNYPVEKYPSNVLWVAGINNRIQIAVREVGLTLPPEKRAVLHRPSLRR